MTEEVKVETAVAAETAAAPATVDVAEPVAAEPQGKSSKLGR